MSALPKKPNTPLPPTPDDEHYLNFEEDHTQKKASKARSEGSNTENYEALSERKPAASNNATFVNLPKQPEKESFFMKYKWKIIISGEACIILLVLCLIIGLAIGGNFQDKTAALKDVLCDKVASNQEVVEDVTGNKTTSKPEDGNICDISGGTPCSADCTGLDSLVILQAKDNHPFLAMCEDGWLILMHRFDGSVNFGQPVGTWYAYKNGFGSVLGEHFIGMDNLVSVLKQKRYKVRFELTSWANETRYAEYEEFDISDEADRYRLEIGGYTESSTAGDSMSYSNHHIFSTSINMDLGGIHQHTILAKAIKVASQENIVKQNHVVVQAIAYR
ncbi:unnamed protein product, partial [Owenia fusiformis]